MQNLQELSVRPAVAVGGRTAVNGATRRQPAAPPPLRPEAEVVDESPWPSDAGVEQGRSNAELLQGVIKRDPDAWAALVDRFQPLVWSITRRYHLSAPDAEDVGQTLWLRLMQHASNVRDPRALPGWIATTVRNLSLACLAAQQRTRPTDPYQVNDFPERISSAGRDAVADLDEDLLRRECVTAVRDGLAELSDLQRSLLLLLSSEPHVSYLEISEQLGVAVGSIGPTRARTLEKLKATRSVHVFMSEDENRGRGPGRLACSA